MDNGGWAKTGLRLYRNAFNLALVEYLTRILKSKGDLKCTIKKVSKSNQYSIYILAEYLPKLKNRYYLTSFQVWNRN